jgi:hypothetical protein
MTEKVDLVAATAEAFLRRFGHDSGRRLEQVLPEIGLELHVRDVQSYEGALLRIKGVPRGYVVLSVRISEDSRRRFTLAHELGHYILPNQQEISQPCTKAAVESWDETLSGLEADANRFAAEILMPRAILLPFLKQSPTFSHVAQVAGACGTSLTASAYRIASLTSFRMAMVWSQAGRARWYKASDEFVRWIKKGQLSPDTFAYDAFRGTPVPKGLESVPASAWLFETGLKADARILEQSLLLPTYDAVLTVLVIPEQIEDWSDSEGKLELDPEQFTLRRKRWLR